MLTEEMKKEHIADISEIEKIWNKSPWSYNMLSGELENKNAVYRVVTENGRAVAYMGIYVASSEGNITNVAVHPDFRRKGYAKALISYFIDYAKEQQLEFLTLEVRKSNENAISLYKKFGFIEVGVRKNYYEGTEDALIMTLYFSRDN